MDLAVSLGRFTWCDYNVLPTFFAGEVTGELKKERHLILYGLSSHPLLQELGDKVPLRFGPKGEKLLEGGDGLLVEVDDGVELGVMEMVPSVWAEDRAILIFTGSSLEPLGWVSGLPGASGLRGNVAVIDHQGRVRFPW